MCVTITLALVAAIVTECCAVSHYVSEVCQACGAERNFTLLEGPFGLSYRAAEKVFDSPLTDWLAAHDKAHTHRWERGSTTVGDLFGPAEYGSTLTRSDARGADFIAWVMAKSSPEEIMEVVRVMEKGDVEEQAAVSRAYWKHVDDSIQR